MRRRAISDEVGLEEAVFGLVLKASRERHSRGERDVDRWLQTARAMAYELPPAEVRLTNIANALDRHPAHVARAFRTRFGYTLGECVRRAQLERATRLLRSTDAGISEVAQRAGYYDHSHLVREFRRWTGQTPSAFRRDARRGG
jgi:AraC family transcriptional regulator